MSVEESFSEHESRYLLVYKIGFMMWHFFDVNTSLKTVRYQCSCWSVPFIPTYGMYSHFTIVTYSPYDATWLPRLHSHHVWLTSLLKSSTSSLVYRFHFSFSVCKFHVPLVHALYFSLWYFFFTNITNLELPIASFSHNLFLASFIS
jgi:hypothetical protein